MTINAITSTNIRDINRVVEDALRVALSPLGLDVKRTNCRYTATNFKVPFEVCVVDSGGAVVTPELTALRAFAQTVDWLPEDFEDRIIHVNRRPIKLSGYKARSRKYPFIGVDHVSGKAFKYAEYAIRTAFTQNP